MMPPRTRSNYRPFSRPASSRGSTWPDPFGKVASLKLTDHIAPSGVHYRELHANCPEPPSGGAWLDVIVNGVRLLLEWNGHGSAPDLLDWKSLLTAGEVASILGR